MCMTCIIAHVLIAMALVVLGLICFVPNLGAFVAEKWKELWAWEKKWHGWFAWHPVRVIVWDGDVDEEDKSTQEWAWFEMVGRKRAHEYGSNKFEYLEYELLDRAKEDEAKEEANEQN